MRIVYCGSSGPLSLLPLQAVLAAGHTVCAVLLEAPWNTPAGHAGFPVLIENDDSVATLAALHDIPVLGWSQSLQANWQALQSLQPDLLLVSCFSKRLPDALLTLPEFGCFNLHPSRLPAYRGPDPLFWQFRDGLTEFGVTLHRMSSHLDAGNILAQTGVTMPDGIDARHAELLLARAGSELLVPVLHQLLQGTQKEAPQIERDASYQGFPSPADFSVSTAWSARHLYNFLCATRRHGVPYRCEVDGRVYQLAHAESFQPVGKSRLQVRGDEILISCNPGLVRARLAAEPG